MAAIKNHKKLLKKLKKQVRELQRTEEQSKTKLTNALKKLRHLTKAYKSKLANKIRIMKVKIDEAKALTYAKVANDIERQLMKGIAAKGKSITTAIDKLEKKHISKLAKGIAKKSKQHFKKSPTKTVSSVKAKKKSK